MPYHHPHNLFREHNRHERAAHSKRHSVVGKSEGGPCSKSTLASVYSEKEREKVCMCVYACVCVCKVFFFRARREF